jgi:outer membrane protein assembly factor BamB
MKKIFYLLLTGITVFTACKDELPEANFELAQVSAFTATAGDAQAALAWTPAADFTPDEYYISWVAATTGVEGGDTTSAANTASITIDGLVNDVNYTFSIQPRYEKGLAGKVSATAKPLNERFPVTNFMARAGNELVRLAWTKPASERLSGYKITVTPGSQVIDINTPATESYNATGLTNGQEYTFSIIGVYPQGNSDAATASATPGQISPIVVSSATFTINNARTFEYNDMYFGENVQSVSWDFDDGSTSVDETPAHAYAATGNYTVTVTVTYTGGATETGSVDIVVEDYKWSSVAVGGYVKVSGAVFSPDGKTIYVPTSMPKGDLVAVDLETGVIKWRFEITTVTYGGGALVGPDGVIYQCGTDSKVYAINPDGTQKWRATVDGVIGAFPALSADGTLYCITNAGTLYALNTASGSEKWIRTITGATTGSAVIVGNDGAVYAGSNKGLFAYNADGTEKWSKSSYNVTERGAMAINGSVIYVALKAGAGVAAVNISDGSEKWTTTSNGDAYCPIVDGNGIIYFTEKGSSSNFNVYAVNSSDGSKIWSTNRGAALTYDGLVLGDNGVVYGGTQVKVGGNYKVFGLNTTDGSVVFEETDAANQIMAGAAIGPDKRLYLGTITTSNIGYLKAYEINAGLETGSWSVRGGDLQGTNRQK